MSSSRDGSTVARPKLGNATQRDVARLASVSQAAVSRVFANNGYVANDVRLRIEAAAEQLGYRPDPLARGLITGQSNIIAVVMASINNPFYPVVLDALTEAIQKWGRQVLLFNAAHDQTVDDLIPLVLRYRVAGIIVTTASLSSEAAALCQAQNVPVVLINRYSQKGQAMAVSCDNLTAGELAAETLIAAGCRDLAYIGGVVDSSTNVDRRNGFLAGAQRHGVSVAVEEQIFSYEWGKAAAAKLFSADRGIDGLFCGDDVIAFGALDCLRHEMGLKVPSQVSVIGFDDVPNARWSSYDLTTFRQPLDGMVEKALELINESPGQQPAIHFIPGELIKRGTVREADGRAE